MSEAKFVKVKVVEQEEFYPGPNFGNYEQQGNLNHVIDSLVTIRNSIPDEYRNTARCIISSSGYEDSLYVNIEVYYMRPETRSETLTREYKERSEHEAKITKERKKYERLRGKFEK
jgi:uncharacterized membrane protein